MAVDGSPELEVGMKQALAELQSLITQSYPDATFRVTRSPEDREIVLLKPVVDIEDGDGLWTSLSTVWLSCKPTKTCRSSLCRSAPRGLQAANCPGGGCRHRVQAGRRLVAEVVSRVVEKPSSALRD